jgi:hypothetical protein
METEQDEILLYTVRELVGTLHEDVEGVLASDCIDFMRLYINKPDKELRYPIVALDSLTKYYTETGTECVEYLTSIFDTIIPLLNDSTPNNHKIFKLVGELF